MVREPIALGVLDQDARFQHCLSQFLDEQRVPVGLGDDLFSTSGGRTRPPVTRATMFSTSLGSRRLSVRVLTLGKTNPWRLKLRPEGEQRKDWQLAHPLDRQIE